MNIWFNFVNFINMGSVNKLMCLILLLCAVGCTTTTNSLPGYVITKTNEVAWAEVKQIWGKTRYYSFSESKFIHSDKDIVNNIIIGANPKYFEVLNEPKFGKDNVAVYYMGYPIPFADPKSFKAVSENIGVDKNYVFRNSKVLEGIKPKDLEVLRDLSPHNSFGNGSSYIKQANTAYYNNSLYQLCDANSYKLIKHKWGRDWSIDAECAYYKNKSFIPSDISSFIPLGYYYAKDSKSIYYLGDIVKDADVDTFELTDLTSRAKDKNHCFYGDKVVDCHKKISELFKKKKNYKTSSQSLEEGIKEMKQSVKNKAGKSFITTTNRITTSLGDNLLTDISELDTSKLPNKYSFTLEETARLPKNITYVKSNIVNELSFWVYEQRERVLEKVTYNRERHIVEDYDNDFNRKTKYLNTKCERQLGTCKEVTVSSNSEPIIREFTISYSNGVWKKKYLDWPEGPLEEYRIFDKSGFLVYLAIFSHDKLTKEYIRSEYVLSE